MRGTICSLYAYIAFATILVLGGIYMSKFIKIKAIKTILRGAYNEISSIV